MNILSDSNLPSQQSKKLQSGIYVFDRLPDFMESCINDPLLDAGLDVVLRIHACIRNPEPQTREEYDRLCKAIKVQERKVLQKWAVQHGLMHPADLFQKQWEAQGRMAGAEHHVYLDETSGLVVKRNIMGNHDTWLQYFQRIAIHNHLFPAVAYKLVGFLEATDRTGNNLLMPLVHQPDIHAKTGALPEKVLPALFMAGFKVTQNQWFIKAGLTHDKWNRYLHPASGILIYDLLPKNVLLTKGGNLAFIDSLIELEWTSKVERLRTRYGLTPEQPQQSINMDYLKKLDDSLQAECKTTLPRSAQEFMRQTQQILLAASQNGES